jgi:hypothetical protein
MSALGQKQTFAVQKRMSALPPIADIRGVLADVRLVPIADMRLCVWPPMGPISYRPRIGGR